jgi:hypothetical protein
MANAIAMFSKNKYKKSPDTQSTPAAINNGMVAFVDPARIRTMADDLAEASGEVVPKKTVLPDQKSDRGSKKDVSNTSPFLSSGELSDSTKNSLKEEQPIIFDEKSETTTLDAKDTSKESQNNKVIDELPKVMREPASTPMSSKKSPQKPIKPILSEGISFTLPKREEEMKTSSRNTLEGVVVNSTSPQSDITSKSSSNAGITDANQGSAQSKQSKWAQKKTVSKEAPSKVIQREHSKKWLVSGVVMVVVSISGGIAWYISQVGWFSQDKSEIIPEQEQEIPLEMEDTEDLPVETVGYQSNEISDVVVDEDFLEEIDTLRSSLVDAPRGEVYGFQMKTSSGEVMDLSEIFPILSETLGSYVEISEWFVLATTESYGVRFGLAVGIDDIARARNNLRNGESKGGKLISALYPETIVFGEGYEFSNSTHEATAIRYYNFKDNGDMYSIDYATTPEGFVFFGTSKDSMRRMIDARDILEKKSDDDVLEVEGIDNGEDIE